MTTPIPTMLEIHSNNGRERTLIHDIQHFGSTEDTNFHGSARIFGAMAEVAGPILEHYHSDLYHDAMFIKRTVQDLVPFEPVEFYYGIRNTGTSIAENLEVVNMMQQEVVLHVKIELTDERLLLTITRVS